MDKIAVLILTYNEEKNLPYALEDIKNGANEIVILDSYFTAKSSGNCKEIWNKGVF